MINLVNPIVTMIIVLVIVSIISVNNCENQKLWKLFDLIWIILAPISTFIFLYSYSINEVKLESQNALTKLKYEAKYVTGTIDRHRNHLKCDQEKYNCESLERIKQFIINKSEKVEKIRLQDLTGMYSVFAVESNDECTGNLLAESSEREDIRVAMLSQNIAQYSTAVPDNVLGDSDIAACFVEPNKAQMFDEIEGNLISYNEMVDDVHKRIKDKDILSEKQLDALEEKIKRSQIVSGILILIAFPFRFSKSVGELAAQYKKEDKVKNRKIRIRVRSA